MVDLDIASAFMATRARLLDRRRFELAWHGVPADGVLAALSAYGNPDGGYGWGLEPDLRDARSQPAAALHAFEVFADVLPATTPRAARLCDWLMSTTLDDGGLPFALPVGDAAGCAPFWVRADPSVSSLQITAVVLVTALRVAEGDPAVAAHPWLGRATDHCLAAIGALDDRPHALALSFALQLLDAVHDTHPEAARLIDRLARHVPADGLVHVGGGLPDEFVRPLDIAPVPDRPVRSLFAPEVVASELERLASLQGDDGGWPVDFASYSPAAALEWRGHATVRALWVLERNGLIDRA